MLTKRKEITCRKPLLSMAFYYSYRATLSNLTTHEMDVILNQCNE